MPDETGDKLNGRNVIHDMKRRYMLLTFDMTKQQQTLFQNAGLKVPLVNFTLRNPGRTVVPTF
jgi:hypothetical protein